VAVPLRTLFEQPSVEGIAAALRSKDLDNSRPIVVRLREGKPELAPLVFIMGVQVYQDVAAAISEQRTIYAMHVPTGEPGGEYRLEDLAAPYVEEILKLNLGRSVVLAGLCFGGVIAFEVARQLENQGQLGHNPKQIRPRAQSVTIFDGALPAARRVDPVKMVESFVLDASARRHLSSRLAAFCKRLLSKETHESEPVRDIPLDGRVVLRLSDSSIDSYLRDVSPWAGRLVIMRALRPRPQPWQIVEEDLGWGGLAQCLQVVGIDADHRGMMDLPHARAVAEQMERCIWS
jgi:thioesterase domain-containing protein